MSGRGKTDGKARGKAKTRPSRAGLEFPVGRVHRQLPTGDAKAWRKRSAKPLAPIHIHVKPLCRSHRTLKRRATPRLPSAVKRSFRRRVYFFRLTRAQASFSDADSPSSTPISTSVQ
ncbi:unnamed protein product [Pleuronectes platessa]|uniref:Histone H2A n=1 Tax=Pleuronectes platessa TaxID=8262 RepID=A0A9N7YLI5_PLEPL|nr:unnamed protein product [Pleuronectes platessa]